MAINLSITLTSLSSRISIFSMTHYTYADYQKLPEGAPYQLIGGDLVKEPAPVPYHQMVSIKIVFELVKFVEERDLGVVLDAPMDVYLSDTEVYQPDIMFISKDRMNIIGEKNIEAAPDLVVEILSPSSAYYDLRHKMHVYETSGVREYWVVDPIEKGVEIYQNINGEFKLFNKALSSGLIRSALLEGFTVELEKVLRPPN